jgi:small subunit ribosomal protein S6
MIREYETTFIVDSLLPEEQINATIDKIKDFIEKNGGKIRQIDRWGKRRLAYEIAKKQYGYYVYIRFQYEGALIKELEREYKLDESIIRYLTVLIPKIVLKNESESEKSSPKKAQENENIETEEDLIDKTPK